MEAQRSEVGIQGHRVWREGAGVWTQQSGQTSLPHPVFPCPPCGPLQPFQEQGEPIWALSVPQSVWWLGQGWVEAPRFHTSAQVLTSIFPHPQIPTRLPDPVLSLEILQDLELLELAGGAS